MKYKQYSTVKLKEIKRGFDENDLSFGKRFPKVGDVAVIVEVYDMPKLAYELECIDGNGITQWLATFSPEEVELELLDSNI